MFELQFNLKLSYILMFYWKKDIGEETFGLSYIYIQLFFKKEKSSSTEG